MCDNEQIDKKFSFSIVHAILIFNISLFIRISFISFPLKEGGLHMADRETQDYLSKGIYGNKKTNPDERNKYFGSLRERVYLSMTIEQLMSNEYLDALKKEIRLHPQQQLLLNGQIDMSKLSPYIKISQDTDCSFRIVSDEGAQHSPFGLIYVSTHAVNEEVVDVAVKYPTSLPNQEKDNEKPSFFKKFFS